MTFEPALSDPAETDTSEVPPILAWIAEHGGANPATQPPAAGTNARSVDLSRSNSLRQLLEERQCLSESLRSIKSRIDEIDTTIKNLMGNATIGLLPGWSIQFEVVHRKAFAVEAGTYRRLLIKPTEGA